MGARTVIVLLTAAALIAACSPDHSPAPRFGSPATDGGVSRPSGDASFACVGVTPPAAAWQDVPGPLRVDAGSEVPGSPPAPGDAGDAEVPVDPRIVGAPMPTYSLRDRQPLSCGFGAAYGLPIYRGKVTFVALLAGWCGFCQAQALKLEELRLEFARETTDLAFVVVNKADAAEQIGELTRRCSFPVLQDLPEVDGWALHAGVKDDFYLYGRDGVLADYMHIGGPRNLNLSTEDGYGAVRTAIRAVLAKR